MIELPDKLKGDREIVEAWEVLVERYFSDMAEFINNNTTIMLYDDHATNQTHMSLRLDPDCLRSGGIETRIQTSSYPLWKGTWAIGHSGTSGGGKGS